MSLQDLIRQAHDDIVDALGRATMPAFAVSSFGKDSLVLLDLLAQHDVDQVLHLEDADEVIDWPFIHEVTERYGLSVTAIGRGRGLFMVVGDTPVFTAMSFVDNRGSLTVFPTQMIPWEGVGSFVCVDGELNAMRTTLLPVDFDLVFSGAKRSDLMSKGCLSFMNLLPSELVEKRAKENFATEVYRQRRPGLMSCDPLLHWTDADVWEYIDTFKLPWSRNVYHDDHTKKSTGMRWCYRCHDPREGSVVDCPRLGKSILNLSGMANDTDLKIRQLGRLGLLNDEEVEAIIHA